MIGAHEQTRRFWTLRAARDWVEEQQLGRELGNCPGCDLSDGGDLQLDIATAVVRIEQAYAEPEMREFLLHRLITCDAPRLRSHLDAEHLQQLNE